MTIKSVWVERNRHPDGRLYNMQFGLCQLGDGLVRVFSFGFLHTRLTLNLSRNHARRKIDAMRTR